MKYLRLFLLALVINIQYVSAQNIVKIEYWLNTDPGIGLATDITGFVPSGDIINHVFSIPANISPGIHTIGVRSMDVNNRWSHTNMFPVLVFDPPANTSIDSIEYFIDTDPGFGSGSTVLGFSPQPSVSNLALNIPASISTGIHTIGVRSKDSGGSWSHTNFFPLLVNDTTTGVIVALEYFWDVDSGFYQAIPYTPSNVVTDLSNELMSLDVPSNLSLGQHNIFIRSLDNRGRWSHTNTNYALAIDVIDALDEFESTGISSYPNPFTDELNINLEGIRKRRLMLYNENGQLVYDKTIEQTTRINTSSFVPGTYTLFIWAENNKIYRSTIIRQ
jgi:hypothetical protein